MNEPFNPIPIPEHLNLAKQEQAAPGNQPGTGSRQANQQSKTRKRTRTPRQSRVELTLAEVETKWQLIKARLLAKLAAIDREKLRQVLLGLGVGTAVVAAIIIAIKLMPVVTTILVLLGLGLALQLWDRLRYLPRPF